MTRRPYSLRPATVEDMPALWPLYVAFRAESSFACWLVDLDRERIEELTAWVIACGCFWVAESDGALVGIIAAYETEHPFTGQRFGEEVAWYITPSYRGGTLWLRLLWHVEQWARQSGLTVLRMVAPAGSTVGKLFARRGYEQGETTFLSFPPSFNGEPRRRG